ncbi:unnamed protein product [Leptidea sinapis]|uniref:Uncharacterized protein n=1 Tax=Leptidea sinapis TaxID=189913 RepID=A0A5E4Q154_9NEOP|nr:unnamed protein product [Leptidea sinapis]
MTIFVPEKRFDMIMDRLSDGYLNIICSVEGVFPQPELVIMAGNRPLNAKSTVNLIDARYTALTSAVVKIEHLPPTVEIHPIQHTSPQDHQNPREVQVYITILLSCILQAWILEKMGSTLILYILMGLNKNI